MSILTSSPRSLISPYLSGMTAGTFWELLKDNRFSIDAPYLGRAVFSAAASLFNTGVRQVEEWLHGDRVAKVALDPPPVFILGHWRSGTTYLHHLMASDRESFVCPTVFQVINPHTFLCLSRIARLWLSALVPKRRPMDEVNLDINAPHEDEFAALLMTRRSSFLSVVFPEREAFYGRYLTFKGVDPREIAEWQSALLYFYRKLALLSPGTLLLKSPSHTGKIRHLLQMIPGARFVHLHRNPYAVFRSYRHYFLTAPQYSCLQRPERLPVEDVILKRYQELYDAYFDDLPLIPEGRFCDVAYEELDRDPLGVLEGIYARLGLPGFSQARPGMESFLALRTGYRKTPHRPIEADLQRRIREQWGRSFESWGYDAEQSGPYPPSG